MARCGARRGVCCERVGRGTSAVATSARAASAVGRTSATDGG